VARAKAAVAATGRAARAKAAEGQLAGAYGALGRAAYERFGESAGPPEAVGPVRDAADRLRQLDDEAAGLTAVGAGARLTPRRIMFGAGGACALALALLLWATLGGGNARGSGGPYASAAAAADRAFRDGQARLFDATGVGGVDEARQNDVVQTHAFEDFKAQVSAEIDALLAEVEPLPVELSEDARQIIETAAAGPARTGLIGVNLVGWACEVPVTVVAQRRLENYDGVVDRLRVVAYGPGDALLHSEPLVLDAVALPGEPALFRFSPRELAKTVKLRIVYDAADVSSGAQEAVAGPVGGTSTVSRASFEAMNVPELMWHIDRNLMPGQGVTAEHLWRKAYDEALGGNYVKVRVYGSASNALPAHVSGECRLAIDVLVEKLGGGGAGV
jgi:hypothetical protein